MKRLIPVFCAVFAFAVSAKANNINLVSNPEFQCDRIYLSRLHPDTPAPEAMAQVASPATALTHPRMLSLIGPGVGSV